jgi:hypothetical protein
MSKHECQVVHTNDVVNVSIDPERLFPVPTCAGICTDCTTLRFWLCELTGTRATCWS